MAMSIIKNGGFVKDEIDKVNANFAEIESDYAKETDIPTVPTNVSSFTNDAGYITSSSIPTVPTKTSDLTNDSGFITSSAIANKVDKETGKGLSTEDYTSAEKTKLAGLSAPTKTTFTTNSWSASGSEYTYTVAANNKAPVSVMRKNGSNYESVIVDVQTIGTNIVITADESFEGYILTV